MTTMKLKANITIAYELKAAWIIALWKAIHGGDPSPEQVAIQAIAALSTRLAVPSMLAASAPPSTQIDWHKMTG